MSDIHGEGVLAVLSATILGLVTYVVWRQQHSRSGYPPGPFTFPILGNLPQMAYSGSLQVFFDSNRKRFGNIFTIEFGGTKQVVLSGYDNMYNILIKNADYSSNRSTKGMPELFEKVAKTSPGLFWAPFPHWKTLRSFTLNVLRDEGMGSQFLETKILREADEFCKFFIEPKLGKSIDIARSIAKATSNVISEMVFGGRSEYDDPKLNELLDSMQRSQKSLLYASIARNLPLVKYLKISGVQDQQDTGDLFIPEMKGRLERHRADLDVTNPADIFDEFLIQQQREKGDNNCYTDGNAAIMTLQLYGAGSETTSTALSWGLLYTCLHPEVQAKVIQEIDNVIGFDRPVKCSDRNDMPYTSATLLEILRLANIVPTGLPHVLDKEMTVDGQKIPAGALLMLNMASVLHDEEVFEHPQRFDPDRFLTGDVKLKKQRLIPFGIGRRACLGESLARTEFFLFYVSLMQKYDIKLAEGQKCSAVPVQSLVNSPQPYQIIFTKRN